MKNGVLKLFALVVMFFSALPLTRAAQLDIPDFDIYQGGRFAANVSVDPGQDPMFPNQGFQFDLILPDGITVDMEKTALSAQLSGFTLRQNYTDGAYRFVVYTSNDPVTYTSNLLEITFNAAANATPGEHNAQIKKVIFSSPLGEDIFIDDSSFIINVLKTDMESYIEIPDFTITRGETFTAPVSLVHENEEVPVYKGFQFDLYLPAHITVDGATIDASLAGATVRYEPQPDGAIRFFVMKNGTPSNSDQLLNITFKADDTAVAGEYPMQIQTVVFSTPEGLDLTFANSETTITVEVPEVPTEVKVTITPSELTMAVGDEADLTADVEVTPPTDDVQIKWSSSDESVATVDENGHVIAKGTGTVTITVTVTAGGTTQTATATITVSAIPATEIRLNAEDITLQVGQTYQLTATVLPENATDKTVTWSADPADGAIATVSADGLVTAVAPGVITVTATCGSVSATCKVTVVAEDQLVIQLDPYTMTIQVGETGEIKATILPESDEERVITWSSDNEDIATVDQNGVVTGVAQGKANITATYQDVSATCVVTVTPLTPVDEIIPAPGEGMTEGDPEKSPAENTENGAALIGHDLIIRVGQTGAITMTTVPEVDYDPNLRWSLAEGGSSLVNMTVDADNTLVATFTGVEIGNTLYTVYVADNPSVMTTGTIKVIAAVPATSLTVTPKDVELTLKDSPYQLTAEITPDNATVKTLVWTSSNPEVATVDDNGLVTPVALGETTVTATTTDGTNLSDYSNVKVVPYTEVEALEPVPGEGMTEGDPTLSPGANTTEGAALIGNDLIIRVGQTATLTIKTVPEVNYDPELQWELADGAPADFVKMTVNPDNSLTATFTGLKIGQIGYDVYVKDNTDVATSGKIKVIAANPILSLQLDPKEIETTVSAGPQQINAIIDPENATVKTLTWTSSDETVATVDANGLVTPLAVGQTVITATTQDGTDLSDTSVVTVIEEGPKNPYDGSDIKVELSEQEFIVVSGTVVDMWARAEGGNPEGWTYNWTMQGQTTTLSDNGDLSITAINENDEPLTQVYELRLRNAWMDETIFEETYLFTVEIWRKPQLDNRPDSDGWYGTDDNNGTYVSAVRIREGNSLGMRVNQPFGGYMNEWEYLWTDPAGEEIGDEREIWTPAELFGAAANSGNERAISDNKYEVTLSNYGPDGETWMEESLQTTTVHVYKRPLVPAQLLRKGQSATGGMDTPETGTTCTFVIMMTPLGNQEILDLGYWYVYGYTDARGAMHEIETTQLRYTHTTADIYNNPENTFWVYSFWTYDDGSVVTSGLRYLDGSEDYDFDASTFDGSTRTPADADVLTGIYTLDGRYVGLDASRLEPGIYIMRHTNSATKIIIP